jgi:hypothetical protein
VRRKSGVGAEDTCVGLWAPSLKTFLLKKQNQLLTLTQNQLITQRQHLWSNRHWRGWTSTSLVSSLSVETFDALGGALRMLKIEASIQVWMIIDEVASDDIREHIGEFLPHAHESGATSSTSSQAQRASHRLCSRGAFIAGSGTSHGLRRRRT